jgi:hypothetical protein
VSLFTFCNKGRNFTEFDTNITPLKGIFSQVFLTVYNQKQQHKRGTILFGGSDTSATSPELMYGYRKINSSLMQNNNMAAVQNFSIS